MQSVGILTSNPVNRSHPLNRGRLAWYLAIPHLYGGRTWYDLLGTSPGVLTSMTSTATGWGPTSRPGGWGCLGFDGSAATVIAPYQAAAAAAFSCSAWVNPSSISQSGMVALNGFDAGGGNYTGWGWGMSNSGSAGAGLTGIACGAAWVPSGWSFPAANAWYHCTVTMTAANTWTFYINGAQVGVNASGVALLNNWPANNFQVGSESGQRYFAGKVDDVQVWNRVLSPAEASSLYDLSRQGYPGALNRRSARSPGLFAASVAPGFAINHFRRRRSG